MSNLAFPDYMVLLAVLAVLFVIGYLSGRKNDTTENFFLGNRTIPMWAACLSFVATEISAVTIIAVPAAAYKENWMYLQLFIGSFAARVFLAFVFIPAFYRTHCTTIYDYLHQRFGRETQVTATLFFFVTRLLASGVRLTVASTAVALLLGWPLVPTLVLFSVVSMFYITWGGIRAIIWTNVWQTCTFVVGGVATLMFLASTVDGGFWGLFHGALNAGKLQVFDWGPAFSDPDFVKKLVSNPNIWWLAILNGFFGSMAAYGTDHELMQRLLTLETREKSQKTTLATPVAGFFVMILYLMIGAGLFVFFQQNAAFPLPDKLDDIYPHFVGAHMPVVLKGLILSVVVMASIDSPLGSLSASFVNDLYRPLIRKNQTDRHYVAVARVAVVLFGVALAVLAYGFNQLTGFLWWAFKVGGVTYGSLLGVFLLGLLTQRVSNKANIYGMTLFALVNAALLILTEQGVFNVGWTWLVLIGTTGTMAFGYFFGPLMEKRNHEKE